MAHAVLEHHNHIDDSNGSRPLATIDSAGTGAYHQGSQPDPRTLSVLDRHGLTDFRHSARKVCVEDFSRFDLVLGMDADNVEDLLRVRRRAAGMLRSAAESDDVRGANATGKAEDGLARVMLFGEFAGKPEAIVDPYYGDGKGFDIAYEQLNRFSRGLMDWVNRGIETEHHNL